MKKFYIHSFFQVMAIFFSISLIPLWASEQAQKYVQEGNQAYEGKNYPEAKIQYEKAINEGLVNAALYYNYANTLYRLEILGKSILYYEKALKLNPTDEDILKNLQFVNARTIDKHPQPEHNILTKIIWRIHASYNLNGGLWFALSIFSGIFFIAFLVLFLPQRTRLILYPIMIIAAFGLFLLSPSLAYRIYQQESVRFAIVLSSSLDIYSGPGESYQILSKVHEGTKFEIEEVSNNWAKVKLANGSGGFVKFSDLGKI